MNLKPLATRHHRNQNFIRAFQLLVLVLSHRRYSYSIGITSSSINASTRATGWNSFGFKLIHRYLFSFVALLAVVLSPNVSPALADSPFDKLVWFDNFDGDSLDYSKWECEINAFGGGNQELQIYTDRPENVRVENGALVIEARNDKFGIAGTVRDYSSGRIRSKNRGDWKFGRIEVRAKMPEGQGLWPAIWLLPSKETYGPWASSGEIDIVEFKGQKADEIFGTIHFGSPWPKNKSTGTTYRLPKGSFVEDFHKFSIEWTSKSITWYVDDVKFQQIDSWSSDAAPFPAPFDQPFHMVLNLAVGGHFVGPVSKDPKTFPAKLLIDYVRVYQ